MTERKIQFNKIVSNQLPSYVREEFPLVSEFLSQYYIGQEFQGAPADLIQNIDSYIKLDILGNLYETTELSLNIDEFSTSIPVENTEGFPDNWGLIKIGDEIITYESKTNTSFEECKRGFSGITSYRNLNNPEELVFSTSSSQSHTATSTVENLSILFLKEFLLKVKKQFLPGFENRELADVTKQGINYKLKESLFIKQSKDFYSSKGTDRSFKILFGALYGKNVDIIKPKEYLFRPSDAGYRVTKDLVVESISGNPFDLENLTLKQDEYGSIPKAYAPVTKIEKVYAGVSTNNYYKISLDADYDRDVRVRGAIYGEFSIHPKTILISNVGSGATVFDVDSTIGFPPSGNLAVTYNDGTIGSVSYESKSINQFYGLKNVEKTILDKSTIDLDTYAYGEINPGTATSSRVVVKVRSVLEDLVIDQDSYYYSKGDKIKIETLGVNSKDLISENVFFNTSNNFDVSNIQLISSNKYRVTLYDDHLFKIGDSINISNNFDLKNSYVVSSILTEKSFVCEGPIFQNLNSTFTVSRNLLKASSSTFNVRDFTANIQNVYKNGSSSIIASPSLPYYNEQQLNPRKLSYNLSGTFIGDTFTIITGFDHGFYTGDSVYYTPEKIITTTLDEEGNTTIASETIKSSLFDEGLYFVKRIDSNTIKLSRSHSDIFNQKFVTVSEETTITNNKLELLEFRNKDISSQKLLREISIPVDDGVNYNTEPGSIGILINGVEILNYKSTDTVFYGEIESININAPGDGYDVINPPLLNIQDPVGTGATGSCSVLGNLQEIRITDPGFDYLETPIIKITGGNGYGAEANVNLKPITHEVLFSSEIESDLLEFGPQSAIGFGTYHKFRQGERVLYKTFNQKGIGGIATDSSYYVSVVDEYRIKLYQNYSDSISGVNTIPLTSYGVGNHAFQSYEQKLVVGSIIVSNSGSNYENKRRTCLPVGVNTSLNLITIQNHNYKSGEIVKYSSEGTPINGLTSEETYYVTYVDENNFKLSRVGITTNTQDFYFKTNQYINFESTGAGRHVFNYPEIKVEIIGKIGISSIGSNTFDAKIEPVFRGEITSVHLTENGVGYGSSEILNYRRDPLFNLYSGSGAELTPIISNGSIVDVLVNKKGTSYNSLPDLVINGNGFGAVLTPIIVNGQIESVKIIEGGIGYNPENTGIDVISSGSGANFSANIKKWTTNLFQKYYNNISDDDGFLIDGINEQFGLQYVHLYAPRNLRKLIYSKDQDSKVLYGKTDLKVVSGVEVNSTDHSPIIGWSYDGYPIYGPYGYVKKSGGIVSQMKSGYTLVIGQNRPSLSAFPAGFFVEDFIYFASDDETVLDEKNGRFCVTPEYPNGTYAYFATLNLTADSSGSFTNFKRPQFPYLIGDTYKSKPNTFNFEKSSNQDGIDLNKSGWFRNSYPYKLDSENSNYNYLVFSNKIKEQISEVSYSTTGSVQNIGIETGGSNYKVGDKIIFDETESGGYGIIAEVSRVGGKSINQISISTSKVSSFEFYPNSSLGLFEGYSPNPHNFNNKDIITISGLSTTSSFVEGVYTIGVTSNTYSLKSSISSVTSTGIVTYFAINANFNNSSIRENDILTVGQEKVKVLNVDSLSSRIRVLRAVDSTVGTSHSATSVLYENPRKVSINVGYKTTYEYRRNKEIYFSPSESLALGSVSGVGIGTTIRFSNPGAGITQIFIPTRTIYLKDHGFETGDLVTYLTNSGTPFSASVDGISTSLSVTNNYEFYIAKVSNDLIGLSTVKVGLGSTGTFVGVASTTTNSTTLYFTGIGTGVYHSFKTNHESVIDGTISKNTVTVSVGETHGLLNDDEVFVNVSPSISTSITVKYNDYNRRLLINPRSFSSVGVNTVDGSIFVKNHRFKTGDKVIYISSSPNFGLKNNEIYYIYTVDQDKIKLTNSYYESQQPKPNTVGITSSVDGSICPINPLIKVYKDSVVIFDLSDSSLSHLQNTNLYPSFNLEFYIDSNFTQKYESSGNSNIFDITKEGVVGVTTDAKVILKVNQYTPESLYYKLVPINISSIPESKLNIVIDDEIVGYSKIDVGYSDYSGTHKITVSTASTFTYQIPSYPELDLYKSNESLLSYDTSSKTAFGSISQINLRNKGQNYSTLPVISNIVSEYGSGAILNPLTNNIGKIKTINIKDIGFDYPSDFTLRPNAKLPQVLKINPFTSFDYIGISSFGYGYSVPPKLIVIDGLSKKVVPEVDLKFDLQSNRVEILKNTFGISRVTPTILPIHNSNGVGISSIRYNSTSNDVTVFLSVGFSTLNTFPFNVNDKVLIENISVGIASTAKGFNSSDYDYRLFTIKSVSPNYGGIGIVTYSLDGILKENEYPGNYDSVNSSGRIIPEKYFPQFISVLKNNDFEEGEVVTSGGVSGIVGKWDNKNLLLKVEGTKNFEVGDILEGSSSNTRGLIVRNENFDCNYDLNYFSVVKNGWDFDYGFLNNQIQRMPDNDYYQNFSYSLKSEIPYETWDDAVSTLNHTAGFKKFGDYQLESSLLYNQDFIEKNSTVNSLEVKTTNTSNVDVVVDMEGVVNLNCVYDFDLVKENSLRIGSSLYSDEISFNSKILSDYSESIGNRVLVFDDISSEFNSFPRPTRYSEAHRFYLSDARSQKYITYVNDRRYSDERQILIVTLLHDDNGRGYINQYGRVETLGDLGSFDFSIDGSEGVLQFYPTKYEINDYDITSLAYDLKSVYNGIGSTSIGNFVSIASSSVIVPSGTSTGIVGIATTLCSSAKVLVQISDNNGRHLYEELNIVHDGSEIQLLSYGTLSNNSLDTFGPTGLGTYYPYFSGSNLNVNFVPNVGVGATVNTLGIFFAYPGSTGIGTFDMKHARIESRSTFIASSGSPTETVIGEIVEPYQSAYFILQVSDLTNNRYQISEVVAVDSSINAYATEFGNVETFNSLGSVGIKTAANSLAQLTFTPLPGISVEVKSYMNALRYEDDEKTLDFYGLNNSALETNFGTYTGTDVDIKRAFNLTNNSNPVFQRNFLGSDPNIVNIEENTITIANHFFVTGEEIRYTFGGNGTEDAIGIGTTSFVGIGTTDKLPSTLYAVKLNDSTIKISATAEDALKTVPKVLDITSVGIGTSHTFTSTNQNQRVIVAIDNIIQSPIVETQIKTTLYKAALTTDDIIYFTGISSFYAGDLIKIGSEIMRVDGVGIGSTNAIRVRRPWMGTTVAGYSTGATVNKVFGNYNIVDNIINFVEAPYGNIPISSTTNPPDSRDWVGITTGSKFQGRSFMRSGEINGTESTYAKNYVYDDMSASFNGLNKTFTLKSQGSNVTDVYQENAVILINDVFQGPGENYDYVLSENSGITSITFTGTASSVSYDPNTANIPIGGIIVSVGSFEGFGYQPLVSAGATAVVSIAGTLSNISIGNSGSGYRSTSNYQVISNTSNSIGSGSTILTINNENSIFKILELTNTGSNCNVSIGTYISSATITSFGSTTVTIGVGNTSQYIIPSNTEVIISIDDLPVGFVNVGIGSSSVGISSITHVGIATISDGHVVQPVYITNPVAFNETYVVIEDPLPYTNIPLIYKNSTSGLGTQAKIDIVVGQGSSIIDFEITNTGYGYGQGEVLTIQTGGLTGIPTTSSSGFADFEITIQSIFNDKFTGWSIGQLEVLDNYDSLFDGFRVNFPLSLNGELFPIKSAPGSNIDVQATLLIFINDILQVPGKGYIFEGGSTITFTEAPKSGDSSKIIFYKGSSGIDVVDRQILETVKIGDDLTIGYDSSIGQPSSLQEEERIVTNIDSLDIVSTNPYFGPGNTENPNLLRPVVWCRQTEDKIINSKEVGKDRELYESLIFPSSYIIQPVGLGSTIIYVDNIRPFFDPNNESSSSLDFQNKVTVISQDLIVGATATCIVSTAGTITSIIINNGGVGYSTNPIVKIGYPVGVGTSGIATLVSSITAGIVTSISITNPGFGYTQTNPPTILIESPISIKETVETLEYQGDSGIIVGLGTTTISSVDVVTIDLFIPLQSFLRNSSITGTAVTVSSLSVGDYFVVYNSNVGVASTSSNSLDISNNLIGIGTMFIDNVYQVVDSQVIQKSLPGIGLTYVNRVSIKLNNINSLITSRTVSFDSTAFSFDSTWISFDDSGSTYNSSEYFTENYIGNYSWGKIFLDIRGKTQSFNFYGNRGVGGISTSALVNRESPLRYKNYTSS
jgi:hypothetical protein